MRTQNGRVHPADGGVQVKWTPERDAALRDMRAKGINAYEIGETLRIGRAAVYDRLRAIGEPIRRVMPVRERRDRYNSVMRLHAAGMPSLEISRALKVRRENVDRIILAHGAVPVDRMSPAATGAEPRVTRSGVGPYPLPPFHPIMVAIYRDAGFPV